MFQGMVESFPLEVVRQQWLFGPLLLPGANALEPHQRSGLRANLIQGRDVAYHVFVEPVHGDDLYRSQSSLRICLDDTVL